MVLQCLDAEQHLKHSLWPLEVCIPWSGKHRPREGPSVGGQSHFWRLRLESPRKSTAKSKLVNTNSPWVSVHLKQHLRHRKEAKTVSSLETVTAGNAHHALIDCAKYYS